VAFLHAAAAAAPDLPAAARFVTHELRGAMQGDDLGALTVDPGAVGRLVGLLAAGRITSRAGKAVLEELLVHGGEPDEIVSRLGLSATGDEDEVRAAIQAVLDQHQGEVARYRAGEDKLQGFFMGQVMRATRGKAEPQVARELLLRMLAG
jgi:Asp-tRNA(Asn)/Glu-tRNA(Gln) amidotransferase B subunit